ncbi:MAG: zinc-binding dehydrogenase [Bacteroidales bacterium]|nr:zinc-binding dehydrogenase [Bacteroidales bacterium]
MMKKLPSQMRAIVQKEIGGDLSIVEIPIPKPAKGQVLVKMEFSSINPSDLSMLQGTYAHAPTFPLIPGIEGSGIVVSHGGGIIATIRKGKRVSCTATQSLGGCWAEYMVTSAMNVIPVDNNISFEQATALIVNPLTAISFIDIAKKMNQKVIVNNAAGGALGKMIQRYGISNGIDVISIVRSQQQLESLKAYGATNVIDSSWKNYKQKLKEVCQKLNAQLFFDAIGGDATADFVEISSEGSHIYLYANLSEEESHFDVRTLLQNKKAISGFYLGSYTSDLSLVKKLKSISKAQKLLKTDLKTEIKDIFEMDKVVDAIKSYKENMSGGKVLLKLSDI